MIGKLSGIVDSVDSDSLVLDIGGVGYQVYCPEMVLRNSEVGQRRILYVYTHLREEVLQLFGFDDTQQKDVFNLLRSVGGVGVRLALNMLSAMDYKHLVRSIVEADKAILSTISGVGPKLAARIILELKNHKMLAVVSHSSGNESNFSLCNDAISALEALGIARDAAAICVRKVVEEAPTLSAEEIVKAALKLRNS